MEIVCLKYKTKTIVILCLLPPESTSFCCRCSTPPFSFSVITSSFCYSLTVFFYSVRSFVLLTIYSVVILKKIICLVFSSVFFSVATKNDVYFSANYQCLCPLELYTLPCFHTAALRLWTFSTTLSIQRRPISPIEGDDHDMLNTRCRNNKLPVRLFMSVI